MNTLIIYDSTVYVISQASGFVREPIGIPFIWAEIPGGKRIKITDGIGVDVSVTPNVAISEDIPKNRTRSNAKYTNSDRVSSCSGRVDATDWLKIVSGNYPKNYTIDQVKVFVVKGKITAGQFLTITVVKFILRSWHIMCNGGIASIV